MREVIFMEETNKIRKRSEIPVEDTWAIEDLYPTDEAWEETLATVEEDKEKLASYAGKLAESGKVLYDYLYLSEMTNVKASRLSGGYKKRLNEFSLL